MKKFASMMIALSSLVVMTACGDGSAESELASVAKPNLVVTAPNFKCGQGVVVIETKNIGTVKAGSSFFRVDNLGSSAVLVPALNPGQVDRKGITVKYKNGALTATIKADSNGTVAESNENDNLLTLTCKP